MHQLIPPRPLQPPHSPISLHTSTIWMSTSGLLPWRATSATTLDGCRRSRAAWTPLASLPPTLWPFPPPTRHCPRRQRPSRCPRRRRPPRSASRWASGHGEARGHQWGRALLASPHGCLSMPRSLHPSLAGDAHGRAGSVVWPCRAGMRALVNDHEFNCNYSSVMIGTSLLSCCSCISS